MAEVNMVKARETFDTLCRMLDNKKWHYEKNEAELRINSSVKGDDLPIDFVMKVNPKNEVVSFLSWMPFDIDESKRVDVALAVCIANYALVDGSFDYNIADGNLLFRLTSSYKDSVLSEALFEYMLYVSAYTVDDYNDKFFAISKGMMTLQQFMESENKS